MVKRLKTTFFFVVGIALLLGINFLFDRFDELTEGSIYERGKGPYERFVDSATTTCIAHHKAKEPIGKTDTQIAAYCHCYANDLASFATADDLEYMARNDMAPPELKKLLDDHAPECARQADAVGK